jgi:hypothetical protein
MRVSLSAVFAVIFVIMLIALGHGAWHSFELGAFSFLVNLFTGGHVTP